ncbi:hypothetical protein LEP1GSC060_1992 [Leptospira weilii serovar Ranarum str. ICFT]|uniref:Uncharacterized protein n=1 Tax=Leptospira weilii serovar Ranarum str. ICFT TaxID=1218598 RepID=N1WA45_9LEPT|nr:hypothetical protein [Leptospira weilii]EMY77111.1 hypothetical protein LEP1GSC060_1992 [Leptospira weilii serovar Ranarum str. ICFT]
MIFIIVDFTRFSPDLKPDRIGNGIFAILKSPSIKDRLKVKDSSIY